MAKYKLSLLHSYLPPEITFDFLEDRFVISTPTRSQILQNKKDENVTNKSNNSVTYSAMSSTVYEKSKLIQIPKHLRNERIKNSQSEKAENTENIHGNTFNISSIPIGKNISTEIPVGIQGLRYHQVKNGILTVFPDFCSFLVAYTDSGHLTGEVMVTSTYALYDLFQYNPDSAENQKHENDGINNSNINDNSNNNTNNNNKDINEINNDNNNKSNNNDNNNNYTTQLSGIKSKILESSPHTHQSIKITLAPHTSMTKVVTSDSHEFFLVKNCLRYSFPDADTFHSMGFSFKNAIGIRKKLLLMIPYSGMLEKVVDV